MWMNGSRRPRSTPAKARRTGNPSPSKPGGAVVTDSTGRSATAAGSGSWTRGSTRMSSAVTAGIVVSSARGGALSYERCAHLTVAPPAPTVVDSSTFPRTGGDPGCRVPPSPASPAQDLSPHLESGCVDTEYRDGYRSSRNQLNPRGRSAAVSGARRVIVGASGSPGSLRALRHAEDLARHGVATLIPVLAWTPPGGDLAARRQPYPALVDVWQESAWQRLWAALEAAWGEIPADL